MKQHWFKGTFGISFKQAMAVSLLVLSVINLIDLIKSLIDYFK